MALFQEPIQVEAFPDGTAIVLHKTESGELATHWRSASGDFYWGHYFQGLVEAQEDFENRVTRGWKAQNLKKQYEKGR